MSRAPTFSQAMIAQVPECGEACNCPGSGHMWHSVVQSQPFGLIGWVFLVGRLWTAIVISVSLCVPVDRLGPEPL